MLYLTFFLSNPCQKTKQNKKQKTKKPHRTNKRAKKTVLLESSARKYTKTLTEVVFETGRFFSFLLFCIYHSTFVRERYTLFLK